MIYDASRSTKGRATVTIVFDVPTGVGHLADEVRDIASAGRLSFKEMLLVQGFIKVIRMAGDEALADALVDEVEAACK